MSNVEFAPFSDRGIIEATLSVNDSTPKFIGGVWWLATYTSQRPTRPYADVRVRCSLPLGLTTKVSAKVKFMGLHGCDGEPQVTVDKNGFAFASGSFRWMKSEPNRTYVPLIVAIEVVGKADKSEEPEVEPEPDIILDVGGREFLASIKQLSKLSATLNDAFKQEFAPNQPKRITLRDIHASIFEVFLKALTAHDMRSITVDNVAAIRDLADRFHAPSLLKRCAQFVFQSKNVSLSEKLLMADTWNDRSLV
ncbi:hypothetical protein AAVH_26244, partial [Aphelenchoides avenae]